MTFGKQLAVMRLVRGLTQQDLANATGVSRAMVWQLESDDTLPSERVETAIKAALRWPADAEVAFRILEH